MSRRDALLLLLLSSIWGASFLFTKVGVEVLETSLGAFERLFLGARVLTGTAPATGLARVRAGSLGT